MSDSDTIQVHFDKAAKLTAGAMADIDAGHCRLALCKAWLACRCAMAGLSCHYGRALGADPDSLKQFHDWYVKPGRVEPRCYSFLCRLYQETRGPGIPCLDAERAARRIQEAEGWITVLFSMAGRWRELPDQDDYVLLTMAASPDQAQVQHACLKAAGIPVLVPYEGLDLSHSLYDLVVRSRPVPVMVRAQDVQAACGILRIAPPAPSPHSARMQAMEPPRSENRPQTGEERQVALGLTAGVDEFNEPNRWASKAASSSIVAWVFPPLALWSVFCLMQASVIGQKIKPSHPARYRRDMQMAKLMVLLATVVWTLTTSTLIH